MTSSKIVFLIYFMVYYRVLYMFNRNHNEHQIEMSVHDAKQVMFYFYRFLTSWPWVNSYNNREMRYLVWYLNIVCLSEHTFFKQISIIYQAFSNCEWWGWIQAYDHPPLDKKNCFFFWFQFLYALPFSFGFSIFQTEPETSVFWFRFKFRFWLIPNQHANLD